MIERRCLLSVLAALGVGTGVGVVVAPGGSQTVLTVVAATGPTGPVDRPAGCQARGLLPDPACTPGAVNPAVTQATIGSTICVRGWTATIRPPVSVTNPIKVEREIAYGIPGPHPRPFGAEELDHLVPLELGGAPVDRLNLWPEAAPGYGQKDQVENRLKAEVCAGQISLAAAQRAIETDWTTAP